MLVDDLPKLLLRERIQPGYYGEFPVCLDGANGNSYEWTAYDIDLEKLYHKARIDAKSYSDTHLADFQIGLMLCGRIIILGPLFPDAQPPQRRCSRCKRLRDVRLYEGYDQPTRESTEYKVKYSERMICYYCRTAAARMAKTSRTDRQKANEAKREIIRELLTEYPQWSNSYIAQLAKGRGYMTCRDKAVGKIRRQLEAEGKIPIATMRLCTDGVVRETS